MVDSGFRYRLFVFDYQRVARLGSEAFEMILVPSTAVCSVQNDKIEQKLLLEKLLVKNISMK